jgi:uncharacterized SAM-binding protein YcdF (DUF218 family)
MRKVIFRRRIFIILFFAFTPLFVYLVFSYDFLSNTRRKSCNILVVEGWLPERVLIQAKEEFVKNHYQLLITTGFPHYNGYLMGSGGKMVFEINEDSLDLPDNLYHISLWISGNKANGEFAHFKLFANNIELGNSFTTLRKKQYNFTTNLDSPPTSISVVFDNDSCTRYKDRNLHIYAVSLNGRIFYANNKNVSYYYLIGSEYVLKQRLSSSTAGEAAEYLKTAGIPDSLIIPVTTYKKIKSKTYSSALDVKEWLEKNMSSKFFNITIFTQGTHARRSLISFGKAFRKTADIGVISEPDMDITRHNWWKKSKGWSSIIYESIGVLYASFFL